MTFTATAVVGEPKIVKENPFNGELFKNADLQETYNKLLDCSKRCNEC